MLSQNHIDIVNSTAPLVEQHAREITEHFYPLMFERYPLVKNYFNLTHQNSGAQRQALANAVVAYAKHIDRLQVITPAVSLIAQKHVSLNILPEHYPIVGECLLESIAAVLGDAITPAVAEAWTLAYQQLANLMIGTEKDLYHYNEQRCGGWRGQKEFIVAAKVKESEVITSFYLQPSDAVQRIDFEPGQFTCLILNIDGQEVRRNYSLSDAPGKQSLRISVKREAGGLVSNHLHDQVAVGDRLNLTAPSGEFTLQNSDRPLVLVTGGVGITPAISIINACIHSGREIHFIHAAINAKHHAFKEHIVELQQIHQNLHTTTVYSDDHCNDLCDYRGFVSEEIIADHLPEDRDVDFYYLGPLPFMTSVNRIARRLQIPADQVHYEFFGPLQQLAPEEETQHA
ncbi:MAG: NO-inducible flavohemoprotein [Cellvibrionaceae bacterium]|nr:NO-inducible flavohemoprotein [Cellvibrionaceae bacterium]|tara:strand:+ start:6847 stop:8046 length:1200 start_codon:yes stop_codon:yes gene_type:complete